MNRERRVFSFIIGVVLLLSLLACGKKGPPFLPEREMPFVVTQLRGEWKDGVVVLNGPVAVLRGRKADTSDVMGCRIYHVWYAFEHVPCEGCPIDYPGHQDVKAEVLMGKEFFCRVPMEKKMGIHFFEVSLIGRKGALGPLSNRIKLTINLQSKIIN